MANVHCQAVKRLKFTPKKAKMRQNMFKRSPDNPSRNVEPTSKGGGRGGWRGKGRVRREGEEGKRGAEKEGKGGRARFI